MDINVAVREVGLRNNVSAAKGLVQLIVKLTHLGPPFILYYFSSLYDLLFYNSVT
jgi:hypothetical protein